MITCSTIALGDRLGAQLSTLSQLFFLSKTLNQEFVLINELATLGCGYQFFKYFDIDIRVLSRTSQFNILYFLQRSISKNKDINSPEVIYGDNIYTRVDKIFCRYILSRKYNDFIQYGNLRNGSHFDEELLKLDTNKNYDITSGFGTYQDWKNIESDILKRFVFKNEIVCKAKQKYDFFKSSTNKTIVSIHFRRTDYLQLSSLNLSNRYYERALSYFNPNDCALLVFSDDINWCKSLSIIKKYNVYFSENNSSEIDMCLMSLCDHHIIANSSFSYWAAILGGGGGGG